jgi:hypothetical protein
MTKENISMTIKKFSTTKETFSLVKETPSLVMETTRFRQNWMRGRLGVIGVLAVAERRKKIAHGETVGERTRLNQAPDGAKEICAGWFSAAPAGASVAG